MPWVAKTLDRKRVPRRAQYLEDQKAQYLEERKEEEAQYIIQKREFVNIMDVDS